MLKENGKKKKYKKMKCVSCRQLFEITEDNTDKIAGIMYVICPYCGQEEILKER